MKVFVVVYWEEKMVLCLVLLLCVCVSDCPMFNLFSDVIIVPHKVIKKM